MCPAFFFKYQMALSKSYLIGYNNERRHYTFIKKKQQQLKSEN